MHAPVTSVAKNTRAKEYNSTTYISLADNSIGLLLSQTTNAIHKKPVWKGRDKQETVLPSLCATCKKAMTHSVGSVM